MKKSTAILLSRQPMRPSGKAEWIRKTRSALQWVYESDMLLYTSAGMCTWEIILVLAKQIKITQRILIPSVTIEDFHYKCRPLASQFELNGESEKFVPVLPDSPVSVSHKDLMRKRDKVICEKADILVPVSVRKNGHMSALLSELGKKDKKIEKRFIIDYKERTTALTYGIEERYITGEIKNIRNGQYITHWTRTANSSWPTERLIDYYTAIIESESYPRNAFATLQNILKTKQIVASSSHMPDNTPTVCFTALSPCEIVPLIRWRARYRQMSFEPYGIGITKHYALKQGIQPVQYYKKKADCHVPQYDMWLTQSSGKKTDWRAEEEYRFRGDFDLSLIPYEKLICFCFTEQEAVSIEKNFGIKALSFI
jgi:hypothetical protein